MPGSWSDFLKLRSGPAPPPSSEAGAVRVYADADGLLRSVQSDGTDAAIGGGGGSTPQQALYSGDGVNIPNGSTAPLGWDSLAEGDELLDRTVPTRPAILAAGLYAFSIFLEAGNLSPGGFFNANFTIESGLSGGYESTACEVSPSTESVVTATLILSAGDHINLTINNGDGAFGRVWAITNAAIVKIA